MRDEDQHQGYSDTANKSDERQRLDLNDLLKRIKDQKKDDKKFNLLILSGVASVAVVVFLILQ